MVMFRQRTGGEVDEWTAKLIKERDGLKCLRCGEKELLTIHHLKKREVNLQESANYDNLATLCRDCHCWIHDGPKKEIEAYTLKLINMVKGKMD